VPTLGIEGPEILGHQKCIRRVAHHRSSDHDVVEVSDDEVGVGNVDVDAERREKKSGEAADREESEEAEGVEHGRIVVDGALVESGRPIENFDGGRQCDSIAQERKYEAE